MALDLARGLWKSCPVRDVKINLYISSGGFRFFFLSRKASKEKQIKKDLKTRYKKKTSYSKQLTKLFHFGIYVDGKSRMNICEFHFCFELTTVTKRSKALSLFLKLKRIGSNTATRRKEKTSL